MNILPNGRYLAAFVLAIGLLVIFISLRRQSRAPNAYAFTDLLLGDDGKASKSAHVLFGSFFITSWVVVWGALSGHLTDVEFSAYLAAWVAPAVTVLITKKSASP